jgi:hypothetical protein
MVAFPPIATSPDTEVMEPPERVKSPLRVSGCVPFPRVPAVTVNEEAESCVARVKSPETMREAKV